MKQRPPRRISALIYLIIAFGMIVAAFTVFWGSIYSAVLIGGALMVVIGSGIICETHYLSDGILEVLIVAAMILTFFPTF